MKLEPSQMHTDVLPLPCFHPVAAFCQVERHCWTWGPTQVVNGLLWGICLSSLVALIHGMLP